MSGLLAANIFLVYKALKMPLKMLPLRKWILEAHFLLKIKSNRPS